MSVRALLHAALAAFIVAAVPARATLYAPIEDRVLVQRATAVAVVQNLDSWTEALPSGLPETRSRFAVLETLKGSVPGVLEVGVIGGAFPDGLELHVPNVPRFEAGRIYLLALNERADGVFVVTELSLGAFDVVVDEKGGRFATRLLFRGPAQPRVFLAAGRPAALAEPVRDLDGFQTWIRAEAARTGAEAPAAYVSTESGALVPERGDGARIKPFWDASWCPDGTEGRACTGAALARWNNGAVATVTSCDEDPNTNGQSGVPSGQTPFALNNAVTAWTNAGVLGTVGRIGYTRGVDQVGNCNPDPVAGTSLGKVVVYLDDLSQFGGQPVTCPFGGGVLGIGSWLTNGTTHSYKGETWKTILAGIGWVRRLACPEGSFQRDLFENVVTHILGTTLGLSAPDISRHPFDTNAFDDPFAVMVSTYNGNRAPGLGTDDISAVCYLYGTCGGEPCPAPGAAQLSAPQKIVAGESVCLTWTYVGGLEPTDYYEVEIATDQAFLNVIRTYREARAFVAHPTSVDGLPKSLYARLRAVRDCPGEGLKLGAFSNVVTVLLEPTSPKVVVTREGPNWFVTPGAAAPKSTVAFRNVGGLQASVSLATSGGLFDLSKTSLTLAAGAEESVELTARAAALSTPGLAIGRLSASWVPATGQPARVLLVPVSLNVADAAPVVPTGAQLSASETRFIFNAPPGFTPDPQTVLLTVTPPPATGQAVFLQLGDSPLPPWLTIQPAGGNFRVPASGVVPVTLLIDRSRRSPSDVQPVVRSFVVVRIAGDEAPGRAVLLDILDNEPPPVTAGAGPMRGFSTAWVVPSTAEGVGLSGARFSTDGWLKNICTSDQVVDLYHTPEGKDGNVDPTVLKATTIVKAGHTVRLSALLRTFFGLEPTPEKALSGQLEVKAAVTEALTLRTNVEGKTGEGAETRYTAEVPTSAAGLLFGRLQFEAFAPGVSDDAVNRTNLILSETTGREAWATITIYDPDGRVVGRRDNQRIPPHGKMQYNGVVGWVAPGVRLTLGSVGVKVTAGEGMLVGIITAIDNRSNSFAIAQLRCALVKGTPEYLIVPGVVRARGLNNTLFSSNVYLVNGKDAPASLTFTYLYNDLDDGMKAKTATASVSIPARGSLPANLANDTIDAMFKLTGQTYGWIRIDGNLERVFATAGASAQVDPNDADKGLKMSLVEAVAANGCDVLDRYLPPIRFAGTEKSLQKRTNLAIVEVFGQTCRVRLAAFNSTGALLAEKAFDLKPLQYLHVNDVFGPNCFGLGDGPFQDVEVIAWVESGDGKVVSFASVNDNLSRNPEVYMLRPSGCPYNRQ